MLLFIKSEGRGAGRGPAMALWDNLHLHELRHRLRPHLSACRNEALATPRRTTYDQTSLCLYSLVFFTRHLFWRPISKTWRFWSPENTLRRAPRPLLIFHDRFFMATIPDQSDIRKTIVSNAPKHIVFSYNNDKVYPRERFVKQTDSVWWKMCQYFGLKRRICKVKFDYFFNN